MPDATANQAMLLGAADAMECVNKPVRIFLVTPVQLGFVGGFKGKGVNADLVQELGKILKAKNCKITEVHYYNGADENKKFVYSCNPDKTARTHLEKKEEKKKHYISVYKTKIYEECLEKVVRVLKSYGVADSLLDEVRNIGKEEQENAGL